MNTYIAMRNNVQSKIQVLTNEIDNRLEAETVGKTSPKISIESADIKGNDVIVIYTVNDEWFDTTLSYGRLREFAAGMGLNEYCEDVVSWGEITQLTGSFDFDTWFTENIEYVVLMWLRVYHVENKFIKITYELGKLIEATNN
ncbi:hypothetical protein MuYL_2501 [Mucilaginibacter xinganensis]|uniref:Uncharacterized protein n=2 Tax=Mucilaginibacter xinganensis TaxID=1234841 RepID=A0A223NXS3_9SPHI|nr:hypothetical protein MuYL_2501 [Mucilaginibacter xinganensis]